MTLELIHCSAVINSKYWIETFDPSRFLSLVRSHAEARGWPQRHVDELMTEMVSAYTKALNNDFNHQSCLEFPLWNTFVTVSWHKGNLWLMPRFIDTAKDIES